MQNKFINIIQISHCKKILQSYKNAIKDALQTKFGSQKEALHQLKKADDFWNDLGNITNEPNRKEGRHRGRSEGGLRKSTESELRAARKCVLHLVEKYLAYLESSQ